MILIVAGSRDYADRRSLCWALDLLHARYRVSFLSLGDARGADATALEWARRNGLHGIVHRAHWGRLGKRAGPERNGRMIATALARAAETGEPVKLLAAPGGVGTADCVWQARAHKIEIVDMEQLLHDVIGDQEDDGDGYEWQARDWGDL